MVNFGIHIERKQLGLLVFENIEIGTDPDPKHFIQANNE